MNHGRENKRFKKGYTGIYHKAGIKLFRKRSGKECSKDFGYG